MGQIIVIGAGAVGLSCALYLQRDGHQVTVVDPVAPGESCSQGNAGIVAVDAVVPNAMPGVLRHMPAYLADPEGPLVIRWPYLPRMLPWLLRFCRAASPRRVREIADALATILPRAFDDYGPLLEDAGLSHLVARQGMLIAFESERAMAADAAAWDLMRDRGMRIERLHAAEIRQMEPSLGDTVGAAMFKPDVGHVVDPLRLVRGFAACFQSRGGRILRERVLGFESRSGQPSGIRTDAGIHRFEYLAIAAGAWSHQLSKKLGSPVPLESERGYHAILTDPAVELRRPVMFAGDKFIATPMAMGLRLAGTVEFAGLEAPPDWRRSDMLIKKAKRLFPGLRMDGASRWMGHRPGLPDTIPVIGRSPHFRNVLYAFGHGHLGLTMAATTGRLIADLAAGRRPPIDLEPFRVDRF